MIISLIIDGFIIILKANSHRSNRKKKSTKRLLNYMKY
ncbi:Uncharacterised protein [Sphingobacterium mizutaii]|uniref:Uncharacterized protein n=1 Tax=Sphingobacterium mizutaii TaxID=1010 RepID=A0AAJ4X9G6_9SPHI|nr:hypothetical protein SAMN05192578_10921 [Sphingobacterium mizutaii]SNV38176.1 Uncharacterised protein [Sphingobacterium mizutaii]